MLALSDIIDNLQATEAAIVENERALRLYPDSPSTRESLASLVKRQRDLENAFARMTDEAQMDVCSYRLFAADDLKPSFLALATAWLDFQSVFTLLYDALKNGPKLRARISPDALAATTFGFGYTFPGSVGVMLTLSNERLLLGETYLDEAMRVLFELAKAGSSDQIAAYAKQLGPAPIRKMYSWVTDHVSAGLGADICWRRSTEVRARLLVEVSALEHLQQAIAETSDDFEETFTVVGQLVGADVTGHSFHFQVEGGSDIRGRMAAELGVEDTLELPKRYSARIRRTAHINFATEAEEVEYALLNLSPP